MQQSVKSAKFNFVKVQQSAEKVQVNNLANHYE